MMFAEKVSNDFLDKVKAISKKHNINPNWLMGVINSETAGTFSPSIENFAGSGATGLIQFMPDTAEWLGTSTYALANMTSVDQLDYVDEYITKMKGDKKIKSYEDLYLLVFYPAAMNKPNRYTFPQRIYRQNSGMDLNNDGKITMREFKTWIKNKIPTRYLWQFLPRYRYLIPVSILVLLTILTLIYLRL